MTDYKRLVSYMYEYENGVKKKNIGYVRIESKTGQVKFTIRLQLLGHLDSIFPVYLLQRDEKEMNLIYLGDAVLKNQVMDSKLTADENNIMDSGYSLADMGGMLLFLNDSIFYATQWDDKQILADEVMEAMKPKSDKRIPEDKQTKELVQEKKEALISNDDLRQEPVNNGLETSPVIESSLEAGEKQLSSSMDAMGKRLEAEASIPKYKLPRGWKTVERLQDSALLEKLRHNENPMQEDLLNKTVRETFLQPSRRGTANRTVFSEAAKARYATLNNKGIGSIAKQAQGLKEQLEAQEIAELAKEKEEQEVKEVQEELKHQEEESTPKETYKENSKKEDHSKEPETFGRLVEDLITEGDISNQAVVPQGEQDTAESLMDHIVKKKETRPEDDNIELVKQHLSEEDSAIADDMFSNYPRIYPFEDNEIILCVKIEPKDLGYLSKEAWSLSNNSFLLHGYYSYRHLIFAKMKDGNSHRYILGVPGIFHNREKLMAKMFGFECFKSIRKRELRQGDYGYWYVVLTI